MSTLLNISDKIGLQSTPNPSLLNLYGGAAAAYSLRQLDYNYTGPAVTVRRDSDQATKDIGFVNGELDTASLEAFTTEDYVRISSDYSGATPDPSAATNSLTVESNQSALGVIEALKCTVTGSSPYFYSSGFGGSGIELNISFDYYIPSGQSLGSIRVGVASPEETFSTTGEWATANFNQTSSYSFVIFRANTNVIGDEFYVKNLVVTQTSANGFVTTWYDQSGSGNNATQATATSQPKIVSLGSTILENGKATLEFNGTSYYLNASTINVPQPNSYFITYKYDNYPANNDLSDGATRQLIDLSSNKPRIFAGVSYESNESASSNQALIYSLFNGANSALAINGGNLNIGDAGTSSIINMDIAKSFNFYLEGKIQEFIIYPSDESNNRTAIETNINDFYTIY